MIYKKIHLIIFLCYIFSNPLWAIDYLSRKDGSYSFGKSEKKNHWQNRNNNKKISIFSTDRNNDGKVDMKTEIFLTNNSKYQQIVYIDENFDGTFDQFEYSPRKGNIALTRKQDRNFDGKIDFIEERKINSKNKYLIDINILKDNNFDGIFEDKEFGQISFIQEAIFLDRILNKGIFSKSDPTCREEAKHALSKFYGDINNAVSDLSKSECSQPLHTDASCFVASEYGFIVEETCIKKYSSFQLNAIIKDTIETGLSCLQQLGTPKSISHLHKFVTLLSGDPSPSKRVKLMCNYPHVAGNKETENHAYDWNDTFAWATSYQGKDDLHPAIALNPKIQKDLYDSDYYALENQGTTIFHELFHNIGYTHSKFDIEYAYTCETCCFADEIDDETVEIACKICRGDFKNTEDINYIAALIKFYKNERYYKFVKNILEDFFEEVGKVDRTLFFEYYVNSLTYNYDNQAYYLAVAEQYAIHFQPLTRKEKNLLLKLKDDHSSDELMPKQIATKQKDLIDILVKSDYLFDQGQHFSAYDQFLKLSKLKLFSSEADEFNEFEIKRIDKSNKFLKNKVKKLYENLFIEFEDKVYQAQKSVKNNDEMKKYKSLMQMDKEIDLVYKEFIKNNP